ncbi:hypothetical protein LH464_06225 [Neorhizobium sp. T786]|uniref:hypothetical protein n=1 Tax=Pseudorhizobium xiangyangii TaxID=2883104 RepID=UPI001CFFEFD7|nr:hypothetical protein [Neorhizobium xiangyangii]MCB5202071.1 hypothetical protein [Neorhizobium xiangyangii]
MSDMRFSFPACLVAGKGQITPDDVGHMRRHMWPEGIGNRQQAAMAIALDECCTTRCPEWTAYLVEAVTDFVVWRQPQPGSVSGATAGWLLEGLTDQGAVRTRTGLDILLRVLEAAREVPKFLSVTALNQVRLALLPEPRGAYAYRRRGKNAVTKSDLAFIWRVLRGGVDRGCVHLSRGELLVLQAIDALATPAEHHPGWHKMMALAPKVQPPPAISAKNWLSRSAEEKSVAHHAA